LEHASILIHHVNSQAVSLDVLDDPKRLKKLHAGMQSDQRSLYDILMGRTGKSEEEIRSTCRKDEDMNATEALAFGLIDRIEPFKVRETPTTD
jgi:ATP-dependent protease ClpP protease subunit